jgi:hypothetical protein
MKKQNGQKYSAQDRKRWIEQGRRSSEFIDLIVYFGERKNERGRLIVKVSWN